MSGMENAWKCEQCKKQFSKKEMLVKHKREHKMTKNEHVEEEDNNVENEKVEEEVNVEDYESYSPRIIHDVHYIWQEWTEEDRDRWFRDYNEGVAHIND